MSGMEKISLFFIVLTTLFLLVGTIYHNSLPIISFKHLPLFAFLCAGGIFLFTVGNKALLKRTGLGVHICNFISFQKALKEYETGHKKIIAQLNVATSIPKNNFGSIVLVIGESANRDHMTAFGNYSRETTPWLSAQSKQNDFILFPNSYACFVQTASVLELALTNANQYNQINFIKSVSIIDIANLCGFNTYWYSNQGLAEKHSSSSSVIARNAQNYRWVLEDYATMQYDERLLDYLKRIPTGSGSNNFIVLHLKGSHAGFNCRYPLEYEIWDVDKNDSLGSNPYDNSIYYTDHVLQEIFEYSKEHLNLQAMVYFSDHGSDIGIKRKPYFTGFQAVRIPFFVYLSKNYQNLYPDTYQSLVTNSTQYFTNDLIFNLIAGLLQTKGPLFTDKENIAGPSYGYNKNNLLTDLGRIRLSEDNGNEISQI